MTPTPAALVLCTPEPADTLTALGDHSAEVTLFSSPPEGLVPGARVLVGAGVSPEELAELCRLVAATPQAVLAVDLLQASGVVLPSDSGLGLVSWESWGECPVAVLGPGAVLEAHTLDLGTLASILPEGPAPWRDRLRIARERTAVRTRQLEISREMTARSRERVERLKGRVKERTLERNRARNRVKRLQADPDRALGRRVREWRSRVGSKRRLLVAAAGIALLTLAALVAVAILWPRVGLALIAAIALVVVVLASALNVVLLRRAAVQPVRPGHPVGPPPPARDASAPIASAPGDAPTSPEFEIDENERVRISEQVNALNVQVADVRSTLSKVERHATNEHTQRTISLARTQAQSQATTQVLDLLQPQFRVPALGGWAASADLILLLVDELRRARPALIVECGSGVSTLLLSLAIKKYDLPTRIVSLDHDAHFGEQTRRTLAQHGVQDIAEVRIAPLTDVALPGHAPRWYDRSTWEDLREIGMLIVDGPPAAGGKHARYPALPLLKDGFADTVSVVLDDTVRADEQEIAQEWMALLPDLTRQDVALEKGAIVLRRESTTPTL